MLAAKLWRSARLNWVFKEKSYWDERFTGEKEYDWLTGFAGIEVLLRKHVRTSDRILVVGCGNSTLSRDMYDSGFTQLTNLDFSAVVIDAMAAQHANCGPTMRWVVGDTISGSGPTARAHVLVKPISANIRTNLMIATDRRTYHLELESTEGGYMAALSWRYPADELAGLTARNERAIARS